MSIYLEEALAVWGDFLQGMIAVIAPYEHHLFFDCMAHCVEFVGAFYNGRYALQTIDCCIPATDSEVGVYVKLPGMVFFSGVSPASPMGWKNTLIQESGRLSDSAQEVTYPLFWHCMQVSTSKVANSMNSISEVQKRKMQEQIKTKQPRWKKKPKEKIVRSP